MMLGNPMLFGEGDTPSAPVTRVGWIQSDGVSCIDLGVHPDDYAWRLMFRIPAFVDFTERTVRHWIHAAEGDSVTATSQTSLSIIHGTSNGWKISYRNGKLTWGDASNQGFNYNINTAYIPRPLDLYFETRGTAPDGAYSVYSGSKPFDTAVDGAYVSSATISTYRTSASSIGTSPNADLYLFGVPALENKTDIKVRGIVMFEKSEFPNSDKYYDVRKVARNYVPAVRNGQAGLYELVTRTFHGNSAGSGTIIYGE